MSASTEKKLRQAAREAGTDKKALRAEAEAKAKAQSKRRWTLGTVAIVLLIAAILLLTIGFWKTLFVALLCAAGVFVGGVQDKQGFLRRVANRLFPPKE